MSTVSNDFVLGKFDLTEERNQQLFDEGIKDISERFKKKCLKKYLNFEEFRKPECSKKDFFYERTNKYNIFLLDVKNPDPKKPRFIVQMGCNGNLDTTKPFFRLVEALFKKVIEIKKKEIAHINVIFEQGCICPATPIWHKDGSEFALASFSNIEGWSTQFANELKITPSKILVVDKIEIAEMEKAHVSSKNGEITDVFNFYHRSPSKEDFIENRGDDVSPIPPEGYRLLIHFMMKA